MAEIEYDFEDTDRLQHEINVEKIAYFNFGAASASIYIKQDRNKKSFLVFINGVSGIFSFVEF